MIIEIGSNRSSGSSVVWNPMNVFSKKRKAGLNSKSNERKHLRVSTWTYTFVYLAYTTEELIPDSEERAKHLMAGIGKKKVELTINSDAQDIHFELLSQFPKLRNGGGFELLRAQEGGRKLLSPIVAPKAGYSVVDFCKENILAREDLTCVL